MEYRFRLSMLYGSSLERFAQIERPEFSSPFFYVPVLKTLGENLP
jgi:hypothetical protein